METAKASQNENTVLHDEHLLDTLIRDTESQDAIWKPANYWKPYCDRIANEIRRTKLSDFRTNPKILKGFSSGGTPSPALPRAAWKRVLWQGIENAPVLSTVVDAYKKLNRAGHKHKVALQCALAKAALDDIAAKFPNFKPPAGICNGNPEDRFIWRGHEISSDWVMILTRIADFYSVVDPAKVKTILEIGPGLGLSTIAHIALNPHINTIINVDIVPVVYVSTQYLRSIDGFDVVDYLQASSMSSIPTTHTGSRPKVYQLPTWELIKLQGQIDYFFNAYSFMEMEKHICQNYADIVNKSVTGGVCLHSHKGGHAVGAGNQIEPVTHQFILGLFTDRFAPIQNPPTYFWEKYALGIPEELSLLTHK